MWTDEELHILGEVLDERSVATGICINKDGWNNMIANVPSEVIPCWYVEEWLLKNGDPDSALDYWVRKLVRDWKKHEAEMRNEEVQL